MALKKIRLFANLREAAGSSEVEASGNNIHELLEDLMKKYPCLEDLVLEDGNIKGHINILVNGDNIRHLNGPDTEVFESDEIVMFPPVSGG
jgi:molybdopterin synthase sulfur carrier subunit